MTRIRYLVAAVLAALLVLAGAAPALAISDGSDATESYPFMGAYKPGFPTPPGPGGNGCGVTLIDPHWGLTAAHCRKNNFAQVGSPIGWTVQFGSADVTRGGEVATVSRFFQLPKSREGFFGKDLMLLRFDEAVDQTPIPVAGASPAVGTTGRILGWGNTATTSPAVYPSMLQETDVDVLDPKTCPNASDGELCVGGGAAKAGNADSGGPLVIREGAGWTLAGVLSGPEQDNDKAAGLYTDVTRHAEWMRMIMRDHATIPDDEVDLGLGGYPALSECASSLVMAEHSRRDDPALLLTNGHCIPAVEETRDVPRRGAFLQNLPADGEVPFADAQGYGLTTARVDRLLFGTMTGTDVAVYRLDASFAELEARGATVLRLAAASPRVGDSVRLMTTEPLTCTIEAVVPTLREEGYELHDLLRMATEKTCETYPGTSGAALVAGDGKTVVGINSSHNDGGEACAEDNPCEVSADGTTSIRPGQAYGQQVTGLNDCIAAGSVFDADAPGCTLTAAADDAAPLNVPLLVGGAVFTLGIAAFVWALIAHRRRRNRFTEPASVSEGDALV
ncbi:trypsin-like serine protease [Microbacterium sp. NPDC091676]|uniref:trypsin-like serine protease n=1 Tax=Microbacterium sp. NPDC091676 TaxID=3364212 RepID=UPI0038015756